LFVKMLSNATLHNVRELSLKNTIQCSTMPTVQQLVYIIINTTIKITNVCE